MNPYEIIGVTVIQNRVRIEISGPEGTTVFVLKAQQIMGIYNAFSDTIFIPHPPIKEPPQAWTPLEDAREETDADM